ncbi:Diguanylate phosphodiesterase [Enterobacter sp. FY-07]|uniref:EAL domain-containing protein n=1 Tax=Kosakonia oryzendophytica TaxID=1005665 RepID=UPI0007781137|nr:EAL domain-containing protein [Kosakonia oryzendophytica]AMO49225.1 Diguanylate phosphodiesterase [Enterobacter sp. FY-07]WBT56312.1 EAL domain-containing protein [Kosakonia oryzendophytica]
MKSKNLDISGKQLRMTVEFQPIIRLSGNKIFRYEAIARFFNADGFLIPAQQSIAAIEQSGAIREVTNFIFESICHLIKLKRDLTISFTLSHLLINDREYLAWLYQQCLHKGVLPQNIEIEISQKTTQAQFIESLPFLKQAKEYGFMISLGDFSAENLQVDSLALFNFDTIKIDRSIIEGIAESEKKLSTLQVVISQLMSTGVTLICEGVKKSSDLSLLNHYSPDGIHGYIFHRPLTFTQIRLLEGF